jgi:hypothetical protein
VNTKEITTALVTRQEKQAIVFKDRSKSLEPPLAFRV